LTGLPPTPAELAAFVGDRSPDAYERAVDRLLASPRYGERWAWDWLDVARYADTNGFQGDPERTMWPWRDWVVNALNSNMPYDRFTIEQLAGDLLPEATHGQETRVGFQPEQHVQRRGRPHPRGNAGGECSTASETTATVWLGSTFTCARCHDHKYDPIRQRDYYAWFDIFNQMSETGRAPTARWPRCSTARPRRRRNALRAASEHFDAVVKEVEAFEWKKFPRAPDVPLYEVGSGKPAR
jgi:hypothetical protein